MQPSQEIAQDIKSLADWVYEQFKPTDPIEVQNILDKPYYFKYCVGETVETPDQVSRKVMERQYEEHTFAPGETKVLMGGAAYIFLCGIAPSYVLQTKSQDAMGDIQELVNAAALAIIGKVNYSRHAEPINKGQRPVVPVAEPSAPAGHNPNVVNDDDGNLPPQTSSDDDAFSNMNPPATEFTIGDDFYDTTANGRGRKNKQFISNEEFTAAQAQHANARA
jgi:hypothetical protein